MKRNRSLQLFIAIVTASLLAGASTHAQSISDRAREIAKQAMQDTMYRQAQGPFTFSAQAPNANGPAVPLTIEDAVRLALENNLDIAVQRLNPEIRDISVAAAYTAYHPTLTGQFSKSSRTTTPTSQLNLATGSAAQVTGTYTYNASIDQPLPWWGSRLQGTFNNNRSDSNSNNNTFNPTYNSTWNASFTQPLLRNRAIDSTRRSIFVSKVNRDISDTQLKQSLVNLEANVRNAYWDFVFATEAVEVARQSLTLASKLVDDNKIKVDVGTLAPLDVISAESQAAQSQQALTSAEGTRRTAELTLKGYIVGGTDDPNWLAILNPVDRPEFNPGPVDLSGAISRALIGRLDLSIVKQNLTLNNEALKMYHNQTLPQLDLSVQYGLSGVGGTQLVRSNSGVLGSSVTQTIPGGQADALSALLRGKNPAWTVGVNVNYPLGLNSQDTTLATAQVQLTQINAQIKTIELAVANQLTGASINLQNTAESVQAAQQARILSQRTLDAEQAKFEVGMSTNYTVIQYQRDLANAQNNELRAILNYRKALVEWDRLQQTTTGSSTINIL